MTTPELSRPVRLDTIGQQPRAMTVEASAEERAALAHRFGLVRLDRLVAETLLRSDEVDTLLTGRIEAALVQSCVASGEDVVQTIAEPFAVRFRPAPDAASDDEEIELDEDEMDVMFIDGGLVDVGEAVAQTLALNLDPFPRAPEAAAALAEAGVKDEEQAVIDSSPFGALAGLKDKLGRG